MIPLTAPSALLLCALLGALSGPAHAAKAAAPGSPVPASVAVPPGQPAPAGGTLPYGSGYEQRLRAAAAELLPTTPPSAASRRSGASHGAGVVVVAATAATAVDVVAEPPVNPVEKVMQRTPLTIAALCALASGTALARNDAPPLPPTLEPATAQVLSATPVLQQVAVPRQVCSTVAVATPPPSGAGAVVGAVVGGVLGHAIGHSGPRAATTVLGAAMGAAVGTQVQASGPAQVQHVQQCETQTRMEYRVSGFTVVYEYAGRRYTTQLPEDPGATLRIQVTPMAQGLADTPVVLAPAPPAGAVAQVALSAPAASLAYAPAFYVYPAWFHMTLGHVGWWR